MHATQPPGRNDLWFVLERLGTIKVFPNSPGATASVVTTIPRVSDSSDCSLAALAFAPDFSISGRAYVSYCADVTTHIEERLSRLRFVPGTATFIEGSEEVLLRIDNYEYGLHANDAMAFGPDGMLYVAFGDGGPQGRGGGDHALDVGDLRGKVLRLDVSGPEGFAVPPDNPFAALGGSTGLVWAYGLRNPWRFSFDRSNGKMWIGDVGHDGAEEINRVDAPGLSFGWGMREGYDCTPDYDTAECLSTPFVPPILAYSHGSGPKQGNSVTGGYVYRGTAMPALRGAYFFADYIREHIWAIPDVDAIAGVPAAFENVYDGVAVSSFAEDQNGELFALDYRNGKLLAIVEAPPSGEDGPPPLLSQTGCFEPDAPATPVASLIPFDVASPLWSDGASKRRWLALPDGASITVAGDGDFVLPEGAVLVKEFAREGVRLETRFLVRDEQGFWGYTYRWNDEQTDATLVPASGATAQVGSGQWTFPSRSQCLQCHTAAAGFALGLEVRQLNIPFSYPPTGVPANQIETLKHIGVLAHDGPSFPALPTPANSATGDVASRARSYLHANCSGCHRAGGPTNARIDLRFDVAFGDTGLCNAPPVTSDLGIPGAMLFAPGDPARSVLAHRVATTSAGIRMPPIARTLTDSVGASLVSTWIAQRTSCAPESDPTPVPALPLAHTFFVALGMLGLGLTLRRPR